MQLNKRIPAAVTDRERDLVTTIANFDQVNLISLFRIREICQLGNDLDYLSILGWMKTRGIVGNNFREWFSSFDGSALNVVAEIRKQIKRENFRKSIFAVR